MTPRELDLRQALDAIYREVDVFRTEEDQPVGNMTDALITIQEFARVAVKWDEIRGESGTGMTMMQYARSSAKERLSDYYGEGGG